MSESTAETGDVYGAQLAEDYGHLGGSEQQTCEWNVNAWLRVKMQELLPGKEVLDVGCGEGRFNEAFEAARPARYRGIEASAEMLSNMVGLDAGTVIRWPVARAVLQQELATRQKLYVLGDLREILPEIGPRDAVAFNIFNIVCFDEPSEPVRAMGAALKPGGTLVCATNTFVPRHVAPDAAEPAVPLSVDLHALGSAMEPLAGAHQFRHILDVPGGKLPLQDHVHTVKAYADAFSPEQWEVQEANLFTTEGCELADPANPAHQELFRQFQAERPLLNPQSHGELAYVKLCIVARKK